MFSTTKHLNKKSNCRFGFYVFFACGIPVILTAIIIFVDIFQIGDPIPDVGSVVCFLSNKGSL